MSILDPDNKLSSLSVDASGRLRVVGGGGGGGGGMDEEALATYLENNGFVPSPDAASIAAATSAAATYTDDQVNAVYASLPPAADVSRIHWDEDAADTLVSNIVFQSGFSTAGAIDVGTLGTNFSAEIVCGPSGVTFSTSAGATINGSTTPVVKSNCVVRLVQRQISGTTAWFLSDAPRQRSASASRSLTLLDDKAVIEVTASSVVLTVPTGLPRGFSCVIIPATGTQVAASGTTLNGAGTTLTRDAADNSMFGIVGRPSSATAFLVSGV